MAAVAFCAVPLPPRRTAGTAADAWLAKGPLRAGAARVRILLGEHPVLAGYAGHRRAARADEPVFVRAVVLEVGGRRAVIAAVDTLLLPAALAVAPGCALVAATHTHTGPGGLWDNTLAGWLGAGAPETAQRDAVKHALDEAVLQATRTLEPAELQVAREDWTAGPARARSDGAIDPQLTAVRLRRRDGATIATVVVYGMHPTSAPRDVLSADWPGQVESDAAPVLVLQGAAGNTTWARDGLLAPAVRHQVDGLLRGAKTLGSDISLRCVTRTVELPPAQASGSVPAPLRRAWGNVLTLGLDPGSAKVTRLTVGPLTLVGVPAEPVGELGLANKPDVLVGLAGGYVGYVETPERWERGSGESAKTYFGPELAHALGLRTR